MEQAAPVEVDHGYRPGTIAIINVVGFVGQSGVDTACQGWELIAMAVKPA